MRAGEQMTDTAGNQISLFPMEYMNISQGEMSGSGHSHATSYAMDFLGWGANGRILKCPYYAPFDCRVVQHASYYNVWQSLNMVITPSGKKYVSFVVMHDDTPPILGTTATQGSLIGHTGTNTYSGGSVSGDHLHLDGANGTFSGWMSGGHDLLNREHLYNLFYVNDTVMYHPMSYNWRTYQGGVTPSGNKYHFKWVLYANKFRNRAIN